MSHCVGDQMNEIQILRMGATLGAIFDLGWTILETCTSNLLNNSFLFLEYSFYNLKGLGLHHRLKQGILQFSIRQLLTPLRLLIAEYCLRAVFRRKHSKTQY